ncbi:AbrB/MazE/SpoVT family DNA-binding domain-containing protein [soil metagenome]|jgi:antitoxin MazE|nr:AbrB/MazE/SpoVT family DNA-binding domain-containing protein [Acidobacteriota bacterium]
MKSKIQKWGNSLAIRIPKPFAVQTEIEQNSIIELSVIDGKIVVEPEKKKPKYTLEELLDGVTEENLHGEIDFGKPIGKEIW